MSPANLVYRISIESDAKATEYKVVSMKQSQI